MKPSLKAEIEKLATAEKRTTASYIEIVLEEHVAAKKAQGSKAKKK